MREGQHFVWNHTVTSSFGNLCKVLLPLVVLRTFHMVETLFNILLVGEWAKTNLSLKNRVYFSLWKKYARPRSPHWGQTLILSRSSSPFLLILGLVWFYISFRNTLWFWPWWRPCQRVWCLLQLLSWCLQGHHIRVWSLDMCNLTVLSGNMRNFVIDKGMLGPFALAGALTKPCQQYYLTFSSIKGVWTSTFRPNVQ